MIRQGLGDSLASQPAAELDELARINVLEQIRRLKEHPIYKNHGRGVPVEGYLLHLETGKLELLHPGGDGHVAERA